MTNWAAMVLSSVASIMLIVSNMTFYIFYKKEISKDASYAKWVKLFPKIDKYLPVLALVINFKLMKLIYSGFCGWE